MGREIKIVKRERKTRMGVGKERKIREGGRQINTIRVYTRRNGGASMREEVGKEGLSDKGRCRPRKDNEE